MFVDILLPLALVLTEASQLRLGDLPIGPGEICLVTWVVLAVGRAALSRNIALTPALSSMLIFWTAFSLAESLGTLAGYVLGDVHDPIEFMHDVMAYPLLAAFSCISLAGPTAGAFMRRTAWFVLCLGAVFVALQLPAAWDLTDLPFIDDPWYWDRFRGWSNNPNQLALFCTVLVLLALHFVDSATRGAKWITALACAIPAFWVGRLTLTDTFLFSLMAAVPFFIAIKLWVWLTLFEHRMTPRSRIATIVLISGPLMLASLVPMGLWTTADTNQAVVGLMKHGGTEVDQEADLRLELWGKAVSRGLESGMLGLGPGPHLPIPWSVIAARQSEQDDADRNAHPASNGTLNFEAHNTLCDLFVQGGLIAVASFVWLVAKAFATGYKAREVGLVALVVGVTAFSMTSLIIRQPIFWFVIALCLTAGERSLLSVRRDYSPEHC